MRYMYAAALAMTVAASSCVGRQGSQAISSGTNPDRKPALPQEIVSAFSALPPDAAEAAKDAAEASPERFQALLSEAIAEDREIGSLLIPVGKGRPLPSDFEPADLTALTGSPLAVSRNDLRLRARAFAAAVEMDKAAKTDGVTLIFSSSYRSYSYQKGLFARNAEAMGEAEANRVSARAGESQHQLGTVVDLGSIDDSFAQTPAYAWMAANAWRFGFSLSFPKDKEALTGYVWESWHYRYITKAGAAIEREFFGGSQVYFLAFVEAYREAGK